MMLLITLNFGFEEWWFVCCRIIIIIFLPFPVNVMTLSLMRWKVSLSSPQSKWKHFYNIIWFFSLVNRFLQLHQLSLLLSNEGHPLFDLPGKLSHTWIDCSQIISIYIVLAAHLLPLHLQALDVWISDRILFLNFWKTGWVEPYSVLILLIWNYY